MDCGFSNHVGSGNNWCSPYKSKQNSKCILLNIFNGQSFPGWQTVYDNDLYKILESHNGAIEDRARVTGAEVALWTETVSIRGTFWECTLW